MKNYTVAIGKNGAMETKNFDTWILANKYYHEQARELYADESLATVWEISYNPSEVDENNAIRLTFYNNFNDDIVESIEFYAK